MEIELLNNKYNIKGTCSIDDLQDDCLSFIKTGDKLNWLKNNTRAIILYPLERNEKTQEIHLYLTGSFVLRGGDKNTWIPVLNPEQTFLAIHNEFVTTTGFYKPINTHTIHPKALILDTCPVTIGKNVIIDPGAVIGCDGFKSLKDKEYNYKTLIHTGGIIIGSYVEIGANTCIDRGTFKNTVLHDHVKIDNQCHIAHNVVIGENTRIAPLVCVGGSVKIGKNVWISMGVMIKEGISIGDNAFLEMGANVTKDVPANGRAKTEKARLVLNR